MDVNRLKELQKDEISNVAGSLEGDDIGLLVADLAEKDDKIRYQAFLLLQASSRILPLVYPYWHILEGKLESDNSYQRSVGLKLIAENVKWDKEGKFAKTLDKYLSRCADEKFITARQAIQALSHIITATAAYNDSIKRSLASFPFQKYKNGQQKLLKKDISAILEMIDEKRQPNSIVQRGATRSPI